jgi:hypothetical protein
MAAAAAIVTAANKNFSSVILLSSLPRFGALLLG